MRRLLSTLSCGSVLILSVLSFGCGPDFYLSDSEAAAYSSVLKTESSANNFISATLQNQPLLISFNNSSSPPTIRTTNLAALMRSHTTFGLIEGFNHQVKIDRLQNELQTQIERWIRGELQLFSGSNDAGVKLTRLTSIGVAFLNKPTFAFHPERQAIGFDLRIQLTINGTIRVDALDPISDFFFGINGTYPLIVIVNNLRLNGEAQLLATYADASRIQFSLTSQPGVINVSDSGSTTAPNKVKDGVRSTLRRQLSQPLRQSFTQHYDHFALAGLGLTPNTSQAASRLRYTYKSLPETAQPVVHVVARSADGKLYHLRKTEGGESVIGSLQPFPSLQTRIQSDPSLVSSAPDQLELAAVTTQAQLVYAHWRDGHWINHRTLGPGPGGPPGGYVGKPAVAASAPGQVEIVVASSRNGALWHIRKRNGVWSGPARIQISSVLGVREAPYRDPVALITGNKVLLLFVDNQNRLQTMAYDLESGLWGQADHIPTRRPVRYAPAATASGNGYVDVVYIGTDTAPYHRLLQVQSVLFAPSVGQTGINLIGNETSIGGSVSTTPSIVCSSYRQLELIARGSDNRLYHNHFSGPASPTGLWDGRQLTPGWQGWTDLNGNFAGTLTFEVMGGFSAAVTRTGKVEVAAIRRPSLLNRSSDQPIVQNSYLSDRFAHAPWKTVAWRGYEQFGLQRFLGSPAVALGDRNIPLAYVDNNLKLQGTNLAEGNEVIFKTLDNNSQVAFSPVPVDPVLVSSLPNYFDGVVSGGDGKLRHIRAKRSGGSGTNILNAPPNVSFRASPAVVGYGSGQLEVVAVAQNHLLYHWRFQNGVWSSAAQLQGSVISQPMLVHLGSGQLLALAIGTDQHLYRWYFVNGAWTDHREVPTGFLVNPILFGAQAASSWGEGSVDVALIESQTGALYHGRLGPGSFLTGFNVGVTPSRSFSLVGGNVIDTPILTAFGPTRLHLLAIGTDHVVYSNWSTPDYGHPLVLSGQAPPIVWTGYLAIGGQNLLLGGVAKTGPEEMTAVGTNRSGRIMFGRYNGGWAQFQPAIGQSANTQLSPPLYRSAIAP